MVRIDIKKTDFFNELLEEQQNEFFYVKRSHYIPCVDNIYYTCFLEDDFNGCGSLKILLEMLEELKLKAVEQHSHVQFGTVYVEPDEGVFPEESKNISVAVAPTGFSIYKYRLSVPDLYDIFVLDYLPNDNTPRILVQIRAYGLWLHGTDKMVIDSFKTVQMIFGYYGLTIDKTRENRIDYCYHTNAIQNPNKFFTGKYLDNYMDTTMNKKAEVSRIEKTNSKKNKIELEYVSFGNRKSNNVFIRIYNKALEVVEMGYKGFFFDMWYNNNLISFYDKYCYEFAYIHKDFFTAIEKAKMHFYIEYGTNESVKKEYEIALSSHEIKYADLKDLTDGVMPELTCVMNIEYETKRKFYYYSDNQINNDLEVKERGSFPAPLTRLFKILDNRALFLDYLTSKTLSFKKDDKYADWWKRLRSANQNSLKIDMPLLREYSQNLDEQQAKVNFINSVATASVYDDKVDSGFIDDVSDIMSNLNDNDLVGFKAIILDPKAIEEWDKSMKENLEERYDPNKVPWKNPHFYDFESLLVSNYVTKKYRKEVYLKNRKKNRKDKKAS